MNRGRYFFISLPFLVLGLAILFHGGFHYYKAHASLDWPVTAGTITYVDLEEKDPLEGGTRYVPHIEYTYRVQEVRHSGATLTFGRSTTADESYARGLTDAYNANPAVEVFYNPAQPDESVLQPGDTTGLTMEVGSGGIFIAIGLFAMVRGLLQRGFA